jgi:hypothetical protein
MARLLEGGGGDDFNGESRNPFMSSRQSGQIKYTHYEHDIAGFHITAESRDSFPCSSMLAQQIVDASVIPRKDNMII